MISMTELTLGPRMPHICGFLGYFSFSHFLATLCCAANRHCEIACVFSKTLKNSARLRVNDINIMVVTEMITTV